MADSEPVSKKAVRRHNEFAALNRTALEHMTSLNIYDVADEDRLSGIICTIGPRSNNVELLSSLMTKGLDVVRMNFSHGTHEYHSTVIKNAREAAKKVNKYVAIALDTKGPEIRTGNFVNGEEVMLETGAEVIVSLNPDDKEKGTKDKFFVDYGNLNKTIGVGGIIYIDDGLVSLEVKELGDDFVKCVVQNSGPISNHKGVNLPNVNVDLPALSDKDKRDLTFGVENRVDMVFASFIRKKEDVLEVRAVVGDDIQIISKIENHEGVQNFDSILEVTDGVMVARGDLGIEIDPQKVFLAQKMMISKCMIAGKPVIVATQMLESMIKNPRPTRAEVSDVANAVLDGADCVMLSGESAKGSYPEEAVSMMASICKESEHAIHMLRVHEDVKAAVKNKNVAETVCCSAVLATFEQSARALIVLSNSGLTARLCAKYRPGCPIIAVVGKSNFRVARQLRITRGVYSCVYDDAEGKQPTESRVQCGLNYASKMFGITAGEVVIAVHADAMGLGFANLTRILQMPSSFDESTTKLIDVAPFADFD